MEATGDLFCSHTHTHLPGLHATKCDLQSNSETCCPPFPLVRMHTLCYTCHPCAGQQPTHTGLFLPASAFKAVRRAAADQLLALQQQHTYADGLAPTPVLPELLSAAAATAGAAAAAAAPQAAAADGSALRTPAAATSSSSADSSSVAGSRSGEPQRVGAAPEIRVLCRTPEQVSAALAVPWLKEVVLDFLEVQGLKEAVAAVRGAGKQVGVGCL